MEQSVNYQNNGEENPADQEGMAPVASKGNGYSDIADARSRQQRAQYVLRLFVTGTTPKSARAISSIKAVCENKLEGRYDLEVIDIYQQPELAKHEQIIAAPTLIKTLPLPLRKLIGNLSDVERVLAGLGLQPVDATEQG
jgi:circadian clock protein KaiB